MRIIRLIPLTEQQVRDIFSGAITNWRAVGGDDQEDPDAATPGRLWQPDGDAIAGHEKCPHDLATGNGSGKRDGGMINVVAEYRNTKRNRLHLPLLRDTNER